MHQRKPIADQILSCWQPYLRRDQFPKGSRTRPPSRSPIQTSPWPSQCMPLFNISSKNANLGGWKWQPGVPAMILHYLQGKQNVLPIPLQTPPMRPIILFWCCYHCLNLWWQKILDRIILPLLINLTYLQN